MNTCTVELEKLEERAIFGKWTASNDKTVAADIRALSKQYHSIVSLPEGGVLPYFVLSRNYQKKSGEFELLIGGALEKDGLECLVLPAGEYAKMTIKPKLGFLWGAAIGEAKRYFYTNWILQNTYRALNMEYEYHTEKSVGRHPAIELIFAIERNE